MLGALPKSAHPGAKKALAEIWQAEDKQHARNAAKAFAAAYGAKFPKAVAKITDDLDELLAFYDYPAEDWVHLRTTNPIEPTFATVRHRSKLTRGPGSRAAGLAMAFKLLEAAQDRWRAVNAPTWSPSSAPAPSSKAASSSNDPTTCLQPKPPKRSSSTGLDDCSRPAATARQVADPTGSTRPRGPVAPIPPRSTTGSCPCSRSAPARRSR